MVVTFNVKTNRRNQLLDITDKVEAALVELIAGDGVCTVFCPHTTAAITINENADPDVCRDFIETLNQLVPANQPHFTHMEGNSDSHLKASLVGASEQIIIQDGKMILGTWQSIYFTEFDGPRTRKFHVGFTKS